MQKGCMIFFDMSKDWSASTVEKMVMSAGTIKQTVWNWEKGIGCSSERMDLIKKLRNLLVDLSRKWSQKARLTPLFTFLEQRTISA